MRQFLYKLPSRIPRSTEELLRWYEKFISPLTLLVGFVLDNFALRRVDFFWGNVLLFAYLATAAISIVFFHLIQTGRLRGKFFLWLIPFTTIAIQFGFGGLFSGFVILYSHSAAYATSWIFVVLLAALMIGNERFRARYASFPFQVSVLFMTLLSFMAFFVPLVTGKLGTGIFLFSQGIAIGAIVLFVRAFWVLMPEVFKESKWTVRKALVSITLIFNVLYFTNAIPPLPLALKDAGVYHSVRKVGDTYQLTAEPRAWYQQYLNYNTTFHRAPGEAVYVFTAVFAPTNLSTTIVHDWWRFDEAVQAWTLESSVPFTIRGGRDKGYRGYTLLENPKPGKWRVNVLSGDKLVGRVSFAVESVETAVETEKEER